jgi:predicted nucleotidyltransferase
MSIRQEDIARAIAIAKEYGATRLMLFGSGVTSPEQARDLDLAVDGVAGWKLYALGARLEEELQIALDLVPLYPPSSFTRMVEQQGQDLL